MKQFVAFTILLVVFLTVTVPVTYIIASNVISDAVINKFSYREGASGAFTKGVAGTSFSGTFNFTNTAEIDLKVNRLNVTVVIINVTSQNYTGDRLLHYADDTPTPGERHTLGSVVLENQLVPAKNQLTIPAAFAVTSNDILDIVATGNYRMDWFFSDLAISGSYLLWDITPQRPKEI